MRRSLSMALMAVLLLPAGTAAQSPAADARDLNLTVYVELLRADVRAQKVAFLTELMALTEAEDVQFWPIYREYDVQLAALRPTACGCAAGGSSRASSRAARATPCGSCSPTGG